MTPERWARLKALFHEVVDLEPPARAARLTETEGDAALAAEVEALVAADRLEQALTQGAEAARSAWASATAADPLIDHRIGPYRITREISRGGMGRVYEGAREDGQFDRRVAIKVVRAGPENPDILARFAAEKRIVASLEHPNIARLLDGGALPDGVPYFVMELVDGEAIDQYATRLALDPRRRAALVRQVALAVAHAHRQLVIHRDLKPSNVLVSADGTPKLLDFGIAKLVDTEGGASDEVTRGRAMTPAYAAPEQILGERVTTATDVYALGVMLYELLAGTRPHGSATGAALEHAIGHDDPVPPGRRAGARAISRDLDAIVMKALQRTPLDRYETAQALADDLGRFLEGRPVAARPVGPFAQLGRSIRRNKALAAVSAAAVLLVVVLGGLWLRSATTAARQAALAEQLGRDVQRIDTTMRLGEMLPLHDLAREREQVRDLMARIDSRRQQLGPAAAGPSWYAIGRGWLALGQPDEARRWLERGWDAGYRTADAAYALGLALGAQYRTALAEADAISNAAVRQARRLEAARDLRDPAAAYLRAAVSADLAAPEYAAGLLALYEGRHDEARAQARTALGRVGWLHEAHVLEGDASAFEALAARDAGQYDAAAAQFDAARDAYTRAARVAPSSARAHLQQCALATARLDMETLRRVQEAPAVHAQAVAACDAATAADADSAAGHAQRARADLIFARFQIAQGGTGSPLAVLAGAERAANAAVARDPSASNLRELGLVYALKGQHDYDFGRDPSDASRQAATYLDRAIAAEPALAYPYFTYGLVLWNQGAWEHAHGRDPRATLERAAERYQQTIDRLPDLLGAYASLGGVLAELADYEVEQGRDPAVWFGRAVTAYEAGLALNPNDVGCLNNLGNLHIAIAARQAATGTDSAPALARAIERHTRVREIAPRLYQPYANLGEAYLGLAAAALASDADPMDWIDRALVSLREARAISATRPAPDARRAHAHRLRAAWRFRNQADIAADVTAGLAAADAALAMNPQLVDALDDAAQLELLRFDAAARLGRPMWPALAAAAARVEQSRQINERRVAPWRLLAEIEIRRATGPAGRPAASRAVEAATRAAAINTSDASARVTEARAWLALGRYSPADAARAREGARAALDRALAINPRHRDALAERSRLTAEF